MGSQRYCQISSIQPLVVSLASNRPFDTVAKMHFQWQCQALRKLQGAAPAEEDSDDEDSILGLTRQDYEAIPDVEGGEDDAAGEDEDEDEDAEGALLIDDRSRVRKTGKKTGRVQKQVMIAFQHSHFDFHRLFLNIFSLRMDCNSKIANSASQGTMN